VVIVEPPLPGAPAGGAGEPALYSFSLSTSFSGPYPPPGVLQAYEAAVPGLAKQIIKQLEAEVAHRREMENRRLEAIIADRQAVRKERRRGQVLGFLLGLAGLGASVWIAYFGHPTTAGAVGVTTVISLVSVFVLGRRHAEQKRQKETSRASAPTGEGQRSSVEDEVRGKTDGPASSGGPKGS
jgi:uncharacterized membrane protein